jgi:putative transposase
MEVTLQTRAEQLANEMAGQARTIEDLNKLMRGMMKAALERMLNTEMDVHLGRKKLVPLEAESGQSAESSDSESKALPADGQKRPSNRRNGRSKKTVRAAMGDLTIATPRDRNSTFEPQLIAKHQRHVPGFDEKILALYAKGMTTRDIQEIVLQLYDVEVSAELISEITADLDKEVAAWRIRPLDAVWPIVYFDGIVVYVRGNSGQVAQHTIYVALGVNLQGRKELIGLWLGENEGAKFWLGVLTDMKNRGLREIFVACIDGLTGFAEAIHTAYPRAKVQLCIVHLVRAALRYVSYEDGKAVAADLKKIYGASSPLEAEAELENFTNTWGEKYPTIPKMWHAKWTDIITIFDFPAPIRRAIYTTNAIESLNSVIRKFTRNRKIYPNEDSAIKLIFMAINEASKKWTMPIHHWKEALNHFAIMFEKQMPELTCK